MTDTKVKLSKATDAQLRAFATTYLGMTIPDSAPTEQVRAKISSAWGKEEILVAAETPPPAAMTGVAPQNPAGIAADETPVEKIKIIIQRTEEAGGDEPVPVSVNGRAMLIPRGEVVSVPRPYFEVLKNAVRYVYEPSADGRGINPEPRKIPSYPYSVMA